VLLIVLLSLNGAYHSNANLILVFATQHVRSSLVHVSYHIISSPHITSYTTQKYISLVTHRPIRNIHRNRGAIIHHDNNKCKSNRKAALHLTRRSLLSLFFLIILTISVKCLCSTFGISDTIIVRYYY